MKRFNHTYQLLAALTLAMGLGSCSQDEGIPTSDADKVNENRTTLMMTVNTPTASTRADGTLSGTDTENALKRLDLFIVYNDNGQKILKKSKTGTNLQTPVLFIFENKTIENATIYVAANMTEAQANQVTINNLNPEMGITGIADVTGDNGFLMTGKTTPVTITAGETTNASATIDRVMSKVLLTCTTATKENVEYVNLVENGNGYIRLANVHYELANTNKKFYAFDNSGEDPNYAINNTLLNDLTNNFFEGNEVTTTSATALKYDAAKLVEGDNRYTEGLYCLENTVNMSDYTGDNATIEIAKQISTWVKISAKFTPACIDGETGLTEEAAGAKLTNGTFYTYKKAVGDEAKRMCYSSIAEGKKATGSTDDNDFIMYEGGILEYETFVNNPADFNAASNLLRNNYYIMHITKMTAPIREKTIEVNTIVKAWDVKGTTTVDIETNN